ncbi:unnamed protein product [Penicillium salamii]|nr:unnamed protein product [Penicillium salamii]CAG8351040.1 unnamed protein product [Penicillium salamii]
MSSQKQIDPKKQQELQLQYTNFKNTLQQLATKIGEIEQEQEEHKLVIQTLDPLEADRKCFRMVNGVLVERTIKDVLPTLKTNEDGLKQVIEDMLKQYKTKQNELDNWKVYIHSALMALPDLWPTSVDLIWTILTFMSPYRKRTISKLCSPRGKLPYRLCTFDIRSSQVLPECECRLSALLGMAKD